METGDCRNAGRGLELAGKTPRGGEVDRGAGGDKRGEPGCHRKAEYNSSEKCRCVSMCNFK